MCVLSNGNLLVSNTHDLRVFNDKFNLIKTITHINNTKIDPFYVTTNNANLIFICDNSKIIRTNLEFNEYCIATYSPNAANNNLRGICYNERHLYVCDNNNTKILKFNENLELCNTFPLEFKPQQIKISNSVVFIRSQNLASINIFELNDLNSLNFKLKYDGHNGTLSEINGYFYEYSFDNSKFYFYDNDGNLIQETIMAKNTNQLCDKWFDGAIIEFNKKIILLSRDLKGFLTLNS